MTRCIVETGYVNFELEPKFDNFPWEMFATAFLGVAGKHDLEKPGGFKVKCQNGPLIENADMSVKLVKSDYPTIEIKPKSVEIAGIPVDQIPHILFDLGELKRQERTMLTLHASAIQTPTGEALLLIGDKGTGKTSTVLSLCLDHGYKFIGDDTVIIGKVDNILYVRGGSRRMAIRKRSLLPFLDKLKMDIDLTNQHGREAKIFTTASEIGLEITDQLQEKPITAIVRVSVSPLQPDTVVSGLTMQTKELLRLHQIMAMRIRGVITPLCLDENGVYGYLPSMDRPDLQRFRNELAKMMIKHNFYYASGKTAREVADAITQQIC